MRSVWNRWPATGPRRATSASNAAGQSSSVPSSRPITKSLTRASQEPRQMMRDLPPPRRPVVRHVVTPQVELVPDPLLREQRREAAGGLERAGRVLPLALAAHEQQRRRTAQPLEMVAVQMHDVVHRVVEVAGLAALPS